MFIGLGLCVKNSAEAVEFYKEVFELELGYHVKNPDGTYFHSMLYKEGKAVIAVSEEASNENIEKCTVSLGVTFESEAEVQRAYDLLREGGKIKTPIGALPWSPCAADVIDKFGVLWYITMPQHAPHADWDVSEPWEPSMYKKQE